MNTLTLFTIVCISTIILLFTILSFFGYVLLLKKLPKHDEKEYEIINKDFIINRLTKIIDDLEGAWEKDNNFQLNEDMVDTVQDDIKELRCEIDGHDFTFDQCGYWQHQYCNKCHKGKYPHLIGKSCSELVKEMGSITEEEFNKNE